jgi:carboxypeptidase C (cathepsin A)
MASCRNKISNMVYIEAPCGVGFSYGDDKSEILRPSDESTAKDNYALIQAFFDRFPEYRQNKFYLSSESYGG